MNILDALEHYAETRHKCGHHLYNEATNQARAALIKAIQEHGSFESFVTEAEKAKED